MPEFDPSKAANSRLVLLAGSDTDARRAGLENLLSAMGVEEDGFDSESHVADATPVAEWVAAACSIPFLASLRVVVVRNVGRIDTEDLGANLVATLREVPESGRLILVADDEVGDADKQGRIAKLVSRWGKAVKDAGGSVWTFEPLTGDKAINAVRDRAKSAGKTLTHDTAKLILEMVGDKINLANSELDKLVLYVGDVNQITNRDVEACVSPDQDYNVYKLVDAVVAGHPGSALVQLRTLLGKGEKIEGEVFSRVFPTLSRQFRLLWQARIFVERNVHPDNPPVDVLAMLPKKPNLADEKDWLRRKFVQSARRINFAQLTQAMEMVVDCDARMKGQRASITASDTLEQTVLRLAQVFR